MTCGSSEPLPKPVKAKTKEQNRAVTPNAVSVDKAETSEVGTVPPDPASAGNGMIVTELTGHSEPTEVGKSSIEQGLSEDEKDVPKVDDGHSAGSQGLDLDIIHLEYKEDPVPPKQQAGAAQKRHGAGDNEGDGMDVDELENMESDDEEEPPLLFRCIACKRCAHYEHCEFFSFANRNAKILNSDVFP